MNVELRRYDKTLYVDRDRPSTSRPIPSDFKPVFSAPKPDRHNDINVYAS